MTGAISNLYTGADNSWTFYATFTGNESTALSFDILDSYTDMLFVLRDTSDTKSGYDPKIIPVKAFEQLNYLMVSSGYSTASIHVARYGRFNIYPTTRTFIPFSFYLAVLDMYLR